MQHLHLYLYLKGDDISTYNGGTVLAMAGKNCVAIATDLRYGASLMTVTRNFPKAFRQGKHCFVGFGGFASDIQTVHDEIKSRCSIYELKEGREMSPQVLANMISGLLYEHRFAPYFIEPMVAGLEKVSDDVWRPFLVNLDCIGAPCYTRDFSCVGTAAEGVAGVCESMWREDMEPNDLFETVSQCMLSALDRNALSGWGVVVHLITPDAITTSEIKCRQD